LGLPRTHILLTTHNYISSIWRWGTSFVLSFKCINFFQFSLTQLIIQVKTSYVFRIKWAIIWPRNLKIQKKRVSTASRCEISNVNHVQVQLWMFQQTLETILCAFVKLLKATSSFVMSACPSVCPHRTTRLPLYRFSWNIIFVYISKICRDNSSFIEVGQE